MDAVSDLRRLKPLEMDVHDQAQTAKSGLANAVAYLEGKFVPLLEAKISIMTHAFLYGSAVFEGIRAYYNKEKDDVYVLRVMDHYTRMKNNGRLLVIEMEQTAEQLADVTVEIIRKSNYKEDVYI